MMHPANAVKELDRVLGEKPAPVPPTLAKCRIRPVPPALTAPS